MDASAEGARSAMYVATIPDGPGHGLSLVMDELAHGVLLASAKGQLLHANQAARHELARRRVVGVHEGHLHTTDAAQSKVLMQALARAETGRRSLIALRTATRQRVSIAVVPLRPERLQPTCSVALLFSRASVCDAVMLCFFARTHGLTPAEEQVLGILCQGYSAPQIALQLHVAVSTIRSHVRSMCAKTHCHGVRALVAQVAVLPPIGAAHLQDPVH
ncbi:LuxR family transcriptional regulator [Ramlibacter sp. USB13]|uniref:LuxR family transcriptional regulator n=1 Tax=Ramlibacter cellulosilyticus TaxID=2764187 RepID=A0A923MRQ2_9BURK|nr:LuxR C-terminal-related transcriptional regulator [Ramlibacter cellulosilyticus]MBC5783960.1 LuxR family transcriptional regulator [Ramlibacter cellulosilyticus]